LTLFERGAGRAQKIVFGGGGCGEGAPRGLRAFLDQFYLKPIPALRGHRLGVAGRRAQGPEPVPDPEGTGQRETCGEKGGIVILIGSCREGWRGDVRAVDDHRSVRRISD
jgi:hypothetical protein